MKVEDQYFVELPHAEVMPLMLSASYLERLVERLDMVDQIEEITRSQTGDIIERVLRYRAPTAGKIPGFLARYADKAPTHVYWTQHERWDLQSYEMTYTIRPEVPAHWAKRYSNSGLVKLTTTDLKRTTVTTTLEFTIDVLMLGKTIERALASEITRLLALQGEALREAARGG